MTKNTYIVAALYKFAPLEHIEEIQSMLRTLGKKTKVHGTLLLAHEGINGTIAGSREGIDTIVSYIRSCAGLEELEYKESFAEKQPFHRMKVCLKKEIVTLGMPAVSPTKKVGTYLALDEWNAAISDPDTIVIDTRNDYEVNIGTFKNALDPKTKTFREFPEWVEKHLHNQKHKKVAMFCTGGIRCEKASSYMLEAGFDTVYHLKGGILQYLEDMPKEKSMWDGDCFVFDQRVAVTHELKQGEYDMLCPSCRSPLNAADRTSEKHTDGVTCRHCYDTISDAQKKRSTERQKQIHLAKQRGEKHIGAEY